MISSLVLLSASVLSTPVFISDVKASREAGHLRVDVRGDGGIDPESARTLIDDGRLVIYLGGTRVRSDNRSWNLQDGAGEIRAHRHRSETELVVPLAGNGCDGPVELTGSQSGITALVGCEGAVVNPRPRQSQDVRVKISKKTLANTKQLKALVELPVTPPERAEVAPSKVAAATPVIDDGLPRRAPQAASAPALVAVAPLAPAPVAPAVLAVAPPRRIAATGSATTVASRPAAAEPQAASTRAPSAPGAVAPSDSRTSSDGSGAGSLRAVALPALLLAALAAAAYWLSRRRRGPLQRHIQILETTSLGPKRALICARIGDETVILSSSEAGITLLKGGQGAASFMPGAVPVVPADRETSSLGALDGAEDHVIEIEQSLEEALADIPEPGNGRVGGTLRGGFRAIEGGLAGLFGKRGGGAAQDESADRFDDLLEDSVEDQELRRKLAAGMSARVR